MKGKYTNLFKKKAVNDYYDKNKDDEVVCKKYSISNSKLHSWTKKYNVNNKKKKYSKELIKIIINEYIRNDDKTKDDICRKYNIRHSTINKWIEENALMQLELNELFYKNVCDRETFNKLKKIYCE